MGSWIELFRALGQALIEVFKAELAELGEDLGKTGRHLGVALGLFAGAAALGFWALAAFLYFLIQLLAVWLPLWGAAGVVTLLLGLAIATLGWLGYRRLQRLENPAELMRHRLDDHRAWWRDRLLPQGRGGRTSGGEAESGAGSHREEELP